MGKFLFIYIMGKIQYAHAEISMSFPTNATLQLCNFATLIGSHFLKNGDHYINIFIIIQCGDKFLMSVGVPLWGRNRSNLYKSNKYFDRFG